MLLNIVRDEYIAFLQKYGIKQHNIMAHAIKLYVCNKDFRICVTLQRAAKASNAGRKKILKRFGKKYACDISASAKMGTSLYFPHPTGIVIGKGVILGDKCTIYQNVTIGQKNDAYPKIGNGVTIYPNAVLVGDIKIGDNAVIGSNSFVNMDIPENKVACGVPCKVK